jgi:hypothetical protein
MQDPRPDPTRYVSTREGERTVFGPDPMLVAWIVGCFAGGSAVCVFLAIASAGMWFVSVALVALAGLLAAVAGWAWWTRHTVLAVGPGGRVCYGGRELCAAGAVRAVRIAEARTGEVGDCDVCLELGGGKVVSLSLPSPYFGVSKSRERAYAFAGQLARALRVGVTESTEPGGAPETGRDTG